MSQTTAIEPVDFKSITEESSRYGRRSFVGYDRGYYDLPNGSRLVFVTLTSSGPKAEGSPILGYFATREVAEDAMDREIQAYIAKHEGHIHWRTGIEAYSEVLYRQDFDRHYGVPPNSVVLAPQPFWAAVCRLAVSPFVPTELTQ